MANENIRHRSTTGTRLTPTWFLGMVEEVLGRIDLDPCSEPGPPWNVPASVHWTKEDDCLTKQWHGGAFVNPPYGRARGVDRILAHLVREYDAGRLEEAIVLLPVDSSTGWWQILGTRFEWCAVSKRIAFDGLATGAGYPSAVFYVGQDPERFRSVFGRIGTIYVPLENGGKLL